MDLDQVIAVLRIARDSLQEELTVQEEAAHGDSELLVHDGSYERVDTAYNGVVGALEEASKEWQRRADFMATLPGRTGGE